MRVTFDKVLPGHLHDLKGREADTFVLHSLEDRTAARPGSILDRRLKGYGIVITTGATASRPSTVGVSAFSAEGIFRRNV